MNQRNTVMLVVFVALGVTLVAGLIAIPAMDQAQASLVGDRVKLAKAVRDKTTLAISDRVGLGGGHTRP